MILAHGIIGLLPVNENTFSLYFFLGSIIPDIDHLLVLLKHKIFSWNKIVDTMRNEEKYGLRFKTKYFHSIFGALIFSLPIYFFDRSGGVLFFIGYLIHLFLDWPDQDKKQYLFPLKIEFKGWLPIFSRFEKIFTVLLVVAVCYKYWL